MNNQSHYFYALELPGEVKEEMNRAAQQLKTDLPFKSWVHPMDLHITLAFLGYASTDQLTEADGRIQEALGDYSAFELEINHLGIFGRKECPRIFWAGIEKSADLHALRERVFSACTASGFQLETRPFSPHITLARKWTGKKDLAYEKLEQENLFKDDKIIFTAERVVLYKTIQGNSPKYEPVTIFPLSPR